MGEVPGNIRDGVIVTYGKRGVNAVKLVEDGRVYRYRDFFVVAGRTGEYVVEGVFCTCNDYLARTYWDNRPCYHSIAVMVAEETGLYTIVDEWYYYKIIHK